MKHQYAKLIIVAICTLCSSFAFAERTTVTGKTAKEIVSQLMPGWNLGNTFDSKGKGLAAETAWGAPLTTPEMIHAVKEAGFRSIRIPVTWGSHTDISDDYWFEIDEAWLNRVKEVIGYCIDEDLYVIVNIHHDTDPNYFFPQYMYEEDSYDFVRDVWTQLAEAFAEFDQHLIFECLNEPRIIGDKHEWWFERDKPNEDVLEAIDMINQANQICVDVTRANGKGYNSERLIMCPGYAACPTGCLTKEFVLPEDEMVAVSVHAYEPNALCLTGGQKTFTAKDDETIRTLVFEPIVEKFINNDIPVVIGETSCSNKLNLDARLAWVDSYYGYAMKYGIPVILWDNHEVGVRAGGENHGYLNRDDLTWTWPEFIEKVMTITGIGINEISSDSFILTYFDGLLTISGETEIERCTIYSANGVVANRFEVKDNSLYKHIKFNKGVYLVAIETKRGIAIKKLLSR